MDQDRNGSTLDPELRPFAVYDEVKLLRSERSKMLRSGLENGVYLEGTMTGMALQSVMDRLLVGAGRDPGEVMVLLARQNWPNASCLGNGVVIMNVALLERLETEDQLAFVLAHELAHQILDHVDDRIEEHARAVHDPEFKKELRRVLRSEYGRVTRLQELLRPVVFDQRRHGRTYELEADSLGLGFMTVAGYDPGASMQVMDILGRSDAELYTDTLAIGRLLNSGDPSRSEWFTKRPSSSLGDFEVLHEALEDSLKTHPDCDLRKVVLSRQREAFKNEPQATVASDTSFGCIRALAMSTMIDMAFVDRDLARVLFLSLHQLALWPEDTYSRAMASRAFSALQVAQDEHLLGEMLAFQAPENSDDHNQLIGALHRMRGMDFAQLAEDMVAGHAEETADEFMLWAQYHAARCNKELQRAEGFRSAYVLRFPNGHYIADLDPTRTTKKK
jgi:hypothetical protein